MTETGLVPYSLDTLLDRIPEGPVGLLFSNKAGEHESTITDHLRTRGISVGSLSYAFTDPHPRDWPIHNFTGRYFSGVYNDRVIGHQFDGDQLDNNSPLIIVSSTYQYGLFFKALCLLLEFTLERKFNLDPETPSTYAYFHRVIRPHTHEVSAENVIVPVIRDPSVWFEYVPIVNGEVLADRPAHL